MTAKVELLTPSGGKVILDPTNTAVDRVLTLPAVAGTVFNQGNVVGTVSQSSGVPTGSIIERGSNANGEFVKYADGTMICYVNGSGWTGGFATKEHTQPASFTSEDVGSSWNSRPTTNHHVVACVFNDGVNKVSFRHPDTSTQPYFIVSHGRWF